MRRTPGLAVAGAAALVAAAVPALSATAAPATVSSFVVVLEPGSASPAAQAARLSSRYGGQVGFVYGHALRGFSIRTTDRAAAALASNPNVAYVEPDGVVSVDAQTTPTGVQRVDAGTNVGIDGVDDQRVDVDVAVIDTGIDLEHPDLAVVDGVNCLSGACVAGGDDDHYHGTHVAGTVAALDNDLGVVGVAPGARLWAVKVLNKRGSGSNSGVIAGIDWVAARASTIEVANLSLGGSYSQAINNAVAGAVGKGVSVVVAAGNSADDAADYSPASEPTAITVSALADFNGLPGGGAAATCRSDVDDTFANFSNYGSPVDIIAPGVCITSTYPLERGSYGTISGTSMAAPHVAGGVALLRSNGTGRSAAESALKTAAGGDDWNDVDDPDSTKEPLLNVALFAPTFVNAPTDGGGGGGGGTDPGSPTFDDSATPTNGGWFATVRVSNATSGSTVSGTWSDGATPSSCVAGTDGTCDITRKVNKRTSSVSWTWDGGGTPVTVTRP